MEVVEFACGTRAPHQGRLLRERLDRRRRLHAPPAARRRRHHQPVQLPGDGAAVVLLDRPRGRQRRDPQAVARRTRPPRTGWRPCSKEAGLPDGVFNVVHGDKEAVDALLEHPDVACDLVRRLDPHRPLRVRDGDRPRQARAGARRREEPHAGASGCRPRPRRRRRRQRGLRLGRRALHGHLGRAGRRHHRRRVRREGRAAHGHPAHRRRHAAAATWDRSSPGSTATRSRRTSTSPAPTARRSSWTAAMSSPTATRTASGSARP